MQRYGTEFEGYRLVIYTYDTHCQVFVYDPTLCNVLHTAKTLNLDAAKFCAVEFTAIDIFGHAHKLNIDLLVALLKWEPVST
jgi:hypothetical protein